MGYNTTVIVLNDALGEIERDPDFGRKLAQAIREQYGGREAKSVHVSAGCHCNAASVIEQHHADNTAIVAVGGNCGTNLALVNGYTHHTPADKERILRTLAFDYGFGLRKRSS